MTRVRTLVLFTTLIFGLESGRMALIVSLPR
jgi:hypothetical protein